jgi:hypothetical protein
VNSKENPNAKQAILNNWTITIREFLNYYFAESMYAVRVS